MINTNIGYALITSGMLLHVFILIRYFSGMRNAQLAQWAIDWGNTIVSLIVVLTGLYILNW